MAVKGLQGKGLEATSRTRCYQPCAKTLARAQLCPVDCCIWTEDAMQPMGGVVEDRQFGKGMRDEDSQQTHTHTNMWSRGEEEALATSLISPNSGP